MKISKLKVRRLIREAIEDFVKSDYVGTPGGEVYLPQDLIIKMKDWVSKNLGVIKKLEKLQQTNQLSNNFFVNGAYDHDKHKAFRNQLASLEDAITFGSSTDVPGGLDLNEMSRIVDKYIIELGDILVKNHSGFDKIENSLRSKSPGSNYRNYDTDAGEAILNQADSLWEQLWPRIDTINLGSVSYRDYIKAKNRAGTGPSFIKGRKSKLERDIGTDFGSSHGKKYDPFLNPEKAGDLQKSRKQTSNNDAKYNAITNQFNAGNTNITSGIGLFKVIISYRFAYHTYEGGTGSEHVDNATILEYDPDVAQDVVGAISAELEQNGVIISETNDDLFANFYLARLDELEDAIFNGLENIGDVYIDDVTSNEVPNYYGDFDYKIETIIKPNSMESLKEFFNRINSGIPTDSSGAQKIRIDHENALEYAMYAVLKTLYGDGLVEVPFSQVEEDLGHDVLHRIGKVLSRM